MKKITLLLLLICAVGVNATYAQSNKELALSKAREAIKIEDEQGRFDDALKLLIEAEQLDPENYNYPFEQAYTYTQKKEYKKAADILERLLKHKDVTGQIYSALGNNYDYLGDREKAMQTYEAGLTKFPKSAYLFVELGNMALIAGDGNKAVSYYEKGIAADPNYAATYYRAAKLFCTSSTEKVWGMIYGEIFMNLDRNSARTSEISKLLFDTYKSQITFPSDGKVALSFSKNINMTVDQLTSGKMPLPMVYEAAMAVGSATEKSIDIDALNRIRTVALTYYVSMDSKSPLKNLLFDYQRTINEAGHLEAYNYWILSQGDKEKFAVWQTGNKDKWEAFVTWFTANPLKVSEQNKFVRVN
jgi:tetratricopeptide (TPR) repeat protein